MLGFKHIHNNIPQRSAIAVVGAIHVAGDRGTRVGLVLLTDIHRSATLVNSITATAKHVLDRSGQQVDFTITHDETRDGIIKVSRVAKHAFASAINSVSDVTAVDVDLGVVFHLHMIATEADLSILSAAKHSVGNVGTVVDVDGGIGNHGKVLEQLNRIGVRIRLTF